MNHHDPLGSLWALKLPGRDRSGRSDQPGLSTRVHPSPLISFGSAASGAAGTPIVICEKSFRTSTPPRSTMSFPQGAEKLPDG